MDNTINGRGNRGNETTTQDMPADHAYAYAQGMARGCAAATADCPHFMGAQAWEVVVDEPDQEPSRTLALIAAALAAWEGAGEWARVLPLAEQEEYFIGWVHGYVVQAEQVEEAPANWADALEGNDPLSPITADIP